MKLNNLPIQEKPLKMRGIALFLVFAIILSIVYPVIAAVPAFAYTGNSMPIYVGGANDNFEDNKDDGDYFEVSAIYQDTHIVHNSRDDQQPDISLEENPVSLSFNLEFYLTEIGKIIENYKPGGGYNSPHFVIATTFGSNMNIPDTFRQGALRDNEYTLDTGQDAGRYDIDSNGNINIYLTDEYIDYVAGVNGKGDVLGTLTFDGQLNRAETADGDQTFNIGSEEITIKFKDQYPTINKSADINRQNGTVTWTIVINNSGKVDLGGYTLTDNLMPDNLTITPELSYTKKGTTLEIADGQSAQKYSISYTTPITPELLKAGWQKNDVTLQKPDDDKSKSTSGDTAYFSNPYYVEKNGAADYTAAGNKYENKINWTITVKSNYGTSLNGYKITDTLNGSTVDLSTATVLPSGSINSDGIYSGDASEITIKYVQENAQGGTTYKNNVDVKTPSGDSVDSKTKDVTYKKDKDFFNFTKTGNLDQDHHTITWTININATDGRTLAGYELTDAEFPSSLSDLNITSYRAQYTNVDAANRTMTLSDGKITFGSNETATNVSFTYTTKFTPPENNGSSEITTDIQNAISDNKEHSTTATVTVKSRNTVTKSSNSGSYDQKASSSEITKILSWTAKIVRDGEMKGRTYQDVLSVTGEGATHTITDAQISALRVQATVGEWDYPSTTLTPGTDYVVQRDGTGFKIEFNESVDAAGYNYFTITYDTTAVMSAVSDSTKYPYQYSFGNKGTFNGTDTGVIGFNYTRNNPEVYDTLDLHVDKKWENGQNIPDSDKIVSVPVAVLYRTNKDGTWRNVKVGANGEYLYYGDAGYDSGDSTVLTITAGVSNEWKSTAENLRKAVAKSDANGNQEAITYYYYKVEEIEPDGTNDGYIKTDNGYYTVSNGNSNGLGEDNSYITITNAYYKNIDLGAKKNWSGSDGSGNGIDSVYIYLQYSIDNGGNWSSVNGSVGNYLFSGDDGYAAATPISAEINASGNWEYPFYNLPAKIRVDGWLRDVWYRYKEYGYKTSGSSEITQIDIGENQSFITDDGYYKVSYSVQNGWEPIYKPQNGNGTLNIQNEFRKTEDLEITVNKQWNNDTGRNVQPQAIKIAVQQQVRGTAAWTTVEEKTLSRNEDGTWSAITFSGENYPSQVIAEDGTITEYVYRAQEIGYSMDGETWVDLALGTSRFATGTNGYYDIWYQNNSISGLESNRKIEIVNNYTPIGTIDITPRKTWKGDADHLTERPTTITFTLQRKIGSGEWQDYEYAPGKSTIELSADVAAVADTIGQEWDGQKNVETVTTTWTMAKITGLPQQIVSIDGGVTTVTNCSYRLVETKHDDVTIPAGETSFKTNDGDIYSITYPGDVSSGSNIYNITNTFKENIGIDKHFYSTNGEPVSVIERSDLEEYKRTIGGKDYYVFNYAINYQKAKVNMDVLPIVDYLPAVPAGFELCNDTTAQPISFKWDGADGKANVQYILSGNPEFITEYPNVTKPQPSAGDHYEEGYFYKPIILYVNFGTTNPYSTDKNTVLTTTTDTYHYDDTNNLLYFNAPNITSDDTVLTYCYSIKIECQKLLDYIGEKK